MIRTLLLFLVSFAVQAGSGELRIVSLAPHLTEILFEIGVGHQIVGTVNYSNYPEAAKKIPQVGGYNRLDLEGILAKQPDLVLGWESGNAPAELERVRQLGLEVIVTEPHQLEEVAQVMELLGERLGHAQQAKERAARYRQQLQQLREQYQQQRSVTVFYQVWNRPLITVNGEQVISDVIELCGGRNIFADLDGLSPQISVEAVLARNPQVIIASGMGVSRPEWLEDWKRYPVLQAVQQENLFHVVPEILQRHGPRLVEGAAAVCDILENVRSKN